MNGAKGRDQLLGKLGFRCLFEGTEKEVTQVFRVGTENTVWEVGKVLNLKDLWLMVYKKRQSTKTTI